jgi:predicted nucleic acid-binding protein
MGREMDVLADTCFFIDSQRKSNGALAWLEANSNYRIVASVITYGELAVGVSDRVKLDEHLVGVPLLSVDAACAWIAGNTARRLKREGRIIGANDIWIAATALQADLPILTRNRDEFSRVAGLRVITY